MVLQILGLSRRSRPMAAYKLGLLTAAFLLCTPYGVLAQGTGGVSGGGSNGIGIGRGSIGIGTGGGPTGVGTGGGATRSGGAVRGYATRSPPFTGHSGNSPFQNSIGIGQIAPSAFPANTAQ